MVRIQIYLFLIGLFFFSCKKEENNPGSTTESSSSSVYPLKIGNSWNYITTWIYTTPTDTFSETDYSYYCIDRLEKIDSNYAYALVQKDSSTSGDVFNYTNFYNLTSEGLLNYGYCMGGNSRVFLKEKSLFEINGIKFRSVYDLRNYFSGNLRMTDSLVIENPPLLTIKDNVQIGEMWIYREAGNPYLIKKKYLGNEMVQTSFGKFLCKKIEFLSDFDNDGIMDNNVKRIQYISSIKGLLKATLDSEYDIYDLAGNYIGKANWKEESIATAVNF